MEFNYRSFGDLATIIRQNIYMLPQDIDLVVGVPRSGMIPAYMIGLYLNISVCSIDEFLAGVAPSHGERPMHNRESTSKRVVIVDDSLHSGVALRKTKERLKNLDLAKYELFFVAIFAREQSKTLVDYCFEVLPLPRFFQWNYLNTNWVSKSCFDIDGVLCIDPTKEQNDDGNKYREFLLTAKPLFIPKFKIHSLVTSRLEKYREETEHWLKEHGVQYDKLIMLDLPSKAERIRLNAHASFKADVYAADNDAVLFVESERRQAIEIAWRTGKPCMCVSTDELFDGRNLPEFVSKSAVVAKKRQRILLYSHELTYTGAPHSLLRIARILKRADYDVEIWAPEEGAFREEIEKSGIPLRIVPYVSLRSSKYLEMITSFDLAIANTVICHRFYEVARKIVPTIWFIREAQNLPNICDSVPLRRNLLCASPDLYCVSEYAKEFIQKTYNTSVEVVHNCVEDYYKTNLTPSTCSNLNKVNFISVGTFNQRKAFDICYAAFEMIPHELKKKAHFYFAGRLNESSRNFWEPLIKKINDNPYTTYIGEITNTEQKISRFREMNVFVVASLDESCSLVVLEGAMLGKPLIVSENVGAKYIVNEFNGWIVKTGDTTALSKALIEAIRNPEKLDQMGINARKAYLKTSTIEIYEKNILEMVKKKIQNYLDKEEVVNTREYALHKMQLEQLEGDNQVLKKEIREIHASWTYRIGRFITFIPRKVRGGIRCYHEHGLRYTLRRVKEKIQTLLS